jgi:hypothetical protein
LHISQRIQGVSLANPETMLMRGYDEVLLLLDKE